MGLSPWERVKVHRDDGHQRAEDEVGRGEDGTGATAVGDLSNDAIDLHLAVSNAYEELFYLVIPHLKRRQLALKQLANYSSPK